MMQEDKTQKQLYDQYYRGSQLIDINSYFDAYRNLIDSSAFKEHYKTEDKAQFIKAISDDFDEEHFDLIADYCSTDNLTVDGELGKMTKTSYDWFKDPEDPSIVEDVQLQTVIETKKRNLLRNHVVHLKYRSEKPVKYEPFVPEAESQILTPETDILIFIRVYTPFTSRCKQSAGALGKLSVDFVTAILASQTLDKLRDQISCVTNFSISTEVSENPRPGTRNAKDVYKSGFIFIEDTFYNDLRDPENKDNSRVIREWAQSRNLGPYKTAKMEETTIGSLVLKFGFPWVYQHQGDCEHLICFSDARLVNPTDELNMSCYPRIIKVKQKSHRYCMTCGIYNVDWVTTSNDRLPHNPCLFCESCFKSYNYIKGKKIGSFKAFAYPFDCDLLPVKEIVSEKEHSNEPVEPSTSKKKEKNQKKSK